MKRGAAERTDEGNEDGELVDDARDDVYYVENGRRVDLEEEFFVAVPEEEDEQAFIERSRQRRMQILAKYGGAKKDKSTGACGITTVGDEKAGQEAAASPTRIHASGAVPMMGPVGDASFSEEDDMFADTPEDKKRGELTADNKKNSLTNSSKGLADNYDDAEGYYNFQVGEILGQRYEVFATHGKGVFSSVLRARDLKQASLQDRTPRGSATNPNDDDDNACRQVAVKVIRANETMFKAGQTEKVILNKLSHTDPDGTMHCIKMLDSFEYRNHLCLVFEAMDMNLRDLTKKYGRGIGLHVSAVRTYATQMFIALHHLRACGVLHADIKPDNILVNDSRSTIKLCDFGSAMFSGDNTITPYLVSRFYRAPEVILGLPYDHPMDMWSVGCVIYELFTGQILFQGRTNNEMIKSMMDVKGPFPKKMIKKAEFAFKYFDSAGAFFLEEEDLLTKQPVKRTIDNPKAVEQESFARKLGVAAAEPGEKKRVTQLVDLLERVLALDPEKRLTPLQALEHPFIKGDRTEDRREKPRMKTRPPAFTAPRAIVRTHTK